MKPIDASILILGCTAQGRINSMVKLIESIETLGIPFKQKVISVDQALGKLPTQWIENYEERGWEVTLAPGGGMVQNVSNGLKTIREDWVFYVEEDVIIKKLPTKYQFAKMVQQVHNGRSPGIISYTYVGYQFKRISQERLSKSVADSSQFRRIDDFLFWARDDSMNYGYHVEFPVTFFKTDLMRSCLECAGAKFKKRLIESGMTAAWFNLGLHNKYFKGTLLNYDADIINDIQTVHPKEYEKMIRQTNRSLWTTQGLPTTPGRKNF